MLPLLGVLQGTDFSFLARHITYHGGHREGSCLLSPSIWLSLKAEYARMGLQFYFRG